ncbi:hypothetical protein EZ313_00755 [Ramlibacter henchirensis]|uniref:Uncharacterized protein n=1 Tax=Ramlibacter henchirensis TaxID=204072 RepID=A0A4Z0C1Y4_9BURK|nr:hypothetical protein [Ramlibacter henchirensis]TFZ05241.1 hypothetical protein EZ313_00755 [Ramlibacter henchirensis]
MNTPMTTRRNLVTLVQILARMERSSVPVDADQYRSVIEHLKDELLGHPHDAGLEALLAAVPEFAELYENLQYEYAGLCRSPLEAGVRAEQAARAAIAAAARKDTPTA